MAQFPHASYKKLLSHKEVMTHLAQGYLPDALSEKFDLDSLELAPTEHTTGDLRRRADDLVWRLRRRNAGCDGEGWAYVFVVLEFQSSPDRHMAVRMLTYLGAFYEDLIAYPGLPQGTKLPEVLPVVIHNGQGKWNATCELDDLIQESAPSLGHTGRRCASSSWTRGVARMPARSGTWRRQSSGSSERGLWKKPVWSWTTWSSGSHEVHSRRWTGVSRSG